MNPEQYIKDTIREVCSREVHGLRSILLTGSMARHETSFRNENGTWYCDGDAECLLVIDAAKTTPTDQRIAGIAEQIFRQLGSAAIRCPVSLSPVTTKYFRKMQPHIFGYELRRCGEVIWGDRAILGLIPKFEASDIPKEDAWRMLANRLIELLECAASDLQAQEPLSRALEYRTAKLYLDMASSYLLFLNKFEAGYRRRTEILEHVAAAPPEHPFDSLPGFVEQVRAATRYKLEGEARSGESTSRVLTAIAHAKALWIWELKRLAGSPDGMPKQSAPQRFRGWAFVARKCGWQRAMRYGPRWLVRKSLLSPRYSIYRAATEVAFGLEGWLLAQKEDTQFTHVKHLLPVLGQEEHSTWRQMSAEIGWNYHQFLETTRA